MNNLEEDIKIESEYFNSIDILSMITNNMTIEDLMLNIQDIYTDDFVNKTNRECLFEYMSGDEFMDYLENRYSDKIEIISESNKPEIIHLREG